MNDVEGITSGQIEVQKSLLWPVAVIVRHCCVPAGHWQHQTAAKTALDESGRKSRTIMLFGADRQAAPGETPETVTVTGWGRRPRAWPCGISAPPACPLRFKDILNHIGQKYYIFFCRLSVNGFTHPFVALEVSPVRRYASCGPRSPDSRLNAPNVVPVRRSTKRMSSAREAKL